MPDFIVNERLVVEVDDSSHSMRADRDAQTNELYERAGLQVLRVKSTEVMKRPGETAGRVATLAGLK